MFLVARTIVNGALWCILLKTILVTPHSSKGAGVFERPGQTMDNLCVFGTSRTSNGLKSGPQTTCHLILMKIYVWSHKISHFWLKTAIL